MLGCYFAVQKCEFYLLGNEYAVYTDHEPLINLRTFRSIVNKRFRWIAYLESMNVKVFYIPGKDNIVSDFISRNLKEEQVWTAIDVGVVDFELTNYSMNELLIEQLNDCEIKTVIDYLQKKSKVGEIPKYFRKHLSKWLTRDKLRRCEKGVIHPKRKPDLVEINNKIERNEDIESDSDSDSSIERNENEPRGNVRYELRRNINLPDRYGDYIVHYAKVLF